MKNKAPAMVAIVTVAMAALLAGSTVASYNDVYATKKYRGDSNAQTSAANIDCPADVFSFFVGVQLQASANCLNDTNMVQDSDGTAIASTPANAAPNQAIELELEFGDDNSGPPDSTPPG
jgi:hypothetical protein